MLYQDGIEYYIHGVVIVRDNETTEKLSTIVRQSSESNLNVERKRKMTKGK